MKNLIVSILLLFFVVSCNKPTFNKEFIQKLSISINEKNDDSKLSFSLLYVKSSKGNVICTDVLGLYCAYDENFLNKGLTFDDFLYKLLNHNITVDENDFCNNDFIKFIPNARLMNEDVNSILKKYFFKQGKKYFLYPIEDVNVKHGVLFKMYQSDYLIFFDDYSGVYSIEKR